MLILSLIFYNFFIPLTTGSADPSMDLLISPVSSNLNNTTSFHINFTGIQNVGNVTIKFNVVENHYIVSQIDISLNNATGYPSEPLYGNAFIFLGIIFLILVGFLYYQTHIAHKNERIIKFSDEELKTIFGLLITVLPISISLFVLSIQQRALKIFILPAIIAFALSFSLAIYGFAIIRDNSVRTTNYIFYSISFIFFGIICIAISLFYL
jgi:cytochrome bd-type quinol oxidase subunit 2